MQQPWAWVLHAHDTYQSLTGSAYLPLNSRRLQLRAKRFSRSSSSGSGGGSWRWKGSTGPSNILCGVLVLVPWLSLVLLSVMLWPKLHSGFPLVATAVDIPGGRQCTGWKQTFFCHPFAARFAGGDAGCDEVIGPGRSGYCVCEGNVTTARMTCGPMQPFTCRQRCMELGVNPTDALELPKAITCPYERPYDPRQYLGGAAVVPQSWRVDVRKEQAKAVVPWQRVIDLIHRHGLGGIAAPGLRNETHDWVREGYRVRADDVQYVAARVEAFKAEIPPYPAGVFKGRGIVMIGGGLRYMTSAWVAVHMIRRSGCRLPIEMWYPVFEAPTADAAVEFSKLGVSTRLLDVPGFNISKPYSKEADATDHNMGRFTLKAAALLLTRFEEVLYLDADNFVLRDPSALFDSQEYKSTAAIFWPDFWSNTLAPETSELLGVPQEQWPAGSFESGQMVIDKSRHWRGLVTAMYINSYAAFWYEMFSCYLGKGDKETFAYAMMSVGEPYTMVRTPPRAIGTVGTSEDCNDRTHICVSEFTGNTMGQADLSGELLFLHSNMHKWDMRLPQKFHTHYERRWVKMMPENVDFEAWQKGHLGYDAERLVYDLVRQLKCLPWWESYYSARVDRGDQKQPELDGFHILLRGIVLQKMYKQGWDGNYIDTISVLHTYTWKEHWHHWYMGHLRPKLVGWHLFRH